MKMRSRGTMTSDPWEDLSAPSAANAINAKRVDVQTPWGFFWARGIDGKCLFVIQHESDSSPSAQLPRFQGLAVYVSEWLDGDGRVLVFELEDSAHRDLFYQLCLDITLSVAHARTEREVVLLALAQTWRWHHFLRGGVDGRLGPEEQKGLVGELLVLERHVMPHLKCADAITSWKGPLGAPKDFEIGQLCIEVKARRGAAAPHVTISSEHQLDDAGVADLYLWVVDLDRAPADAAGSFTLSEVAARLRSFVELTDPACLADFEGLLAASGFRWSDLYDDFHWLEGDHRAYRVHKNFPRVRGSTLLSGVASVRYTVSLPECQPFMIALEDIAVAIEDLTNEQ